MTGPDIEPMMHPLDRWTNELKASQCQANHIRYNVKYVFVLYFKKNIIIIGIFSIIFSNFMRFDFQPNLYAFFYGAETIWFISSIFLAIKGPF
jgi:hypothetical protein